MARKAEAIAELIGRASQALELLRALGIEKAQSGLRRGSELPNSIPIETHRPALPMLLEKPPQRRQEHRIEMSRFR